MVSVNAREWLGEEPSHFLAASAGIGLSQQVVSWLRSFGFGVQDSILQAIAGALIVKYGGTKHVLLGAFGRGILYQLVGGLINGAVGGGLGALTGGGMAATSNVFGGA